MVTRVTLTDEAVDFSVVGKTGQRVLFILNDKGKNTKI